MLLLVIAFIALGWVAFAFSWWRDRYETHTGFGFSSRSYPAFGSAYGSRFAAPQNTYEARLRRQHVLVGLIVAAVFTFAMTRLWSAFWVLQIAVDLALVAFVIALYLRATGGLPVYNGQPMTTPTEFVSRTAVRPQQGWVSSQQSVLSAVPRRPTSISTTSRDIEIPEARLARMSNRANFGPVVDDTRTAVRVGPSR